MYICMWIDLLNAGIYMLDAVCNINTFKHIYVYVNEYLLNKNMYLSSAVRIFTCLIM